MDNLLSREGDSFHEFKRQANVASFPNDFSRYVDQAGKTYYWTPGKFHVVTDAALAKEVLKNQKFSADRSSFFMSRMPHLDLGLIQDFFSVVQKMMVMSDGEDHKKRRGAASLGFEDHVLDRFKSKVDNTVADLLSNACQNDIIDFASIANRLPSIVLADLFSIPQRDREEFLANSLNMTAFFGGGTGYENEDGVRVNKSAAALRDYFEELIASRKQDLGEDYISSLIRMQKKFDLSDGELVSQAIMMLVAGQVTTSDQMCNNMYLLASDQELQATLKRDSSLIAPALEEFMRFDPAVTFIFRVAAADGRIGDQPIKKGDTIFICTHLVNRSGVENGYEVDIHRKVKSHFAFGYGPHLCIGARLARMEMQSIFKEIINRFPSLTVDSAQRDHYSLSFSGFKSLTLRVSQ